MGSQETVPFEVVLDSGAADHVADNVDAPGYGVVPSAGSKAGKGFIAANGARIPNRGQMAFSLRTDDGGRLKSTFQVCETSRPLWSVGKICDSGHKVIFTAAGAQIVHEKTGKTHCSFDRKNGLYVASLKLANPTRESDFARQGR